MKKFLIILIIALATGVQAQPWRSGTSTSEVTTIVQDSSGWKKINSTNIGLKVPTDNVVVGGTTAQSYRLAVRQTAGVTAPFALLLDASGVDSSTTTNASGQWGFHRAIQSGYAITAGGARFSTVVADGFTAIVSAGGSIWDMATLVNSGSGEGTGAEIAIDNANIRTITRSSVKDLELFPASSSGITIKGNGGGIGFNTSAIQGFFTFRASGIADTFAVFRNDKNSTLDSTVIVHANGFVEHTKATSAIGDTIGYVLSSGAIAASKSSNVIIDTEGATNADTCTTLTAPAIGWIVYVSSRHANRDVTFLDTGNFALGAERVLTDPGDVLVLKATSTTTWKEVSFANNN